MTINTANATTQAVTVNTNFVTTSTGIGVLANALTSGNAATISSNSTAGAVSGSSYLLKLARSGANANSSHTAYGISSVVTNTGTTSTNVGGYFSASGATNNYGIIVPSGGIGIGTTTVPVTAIGAAILAINGTNASTSGPHVQYTTASDAYPLFQQLNWAHDNVNFCFDCYYDGAWKNGGSNASYLIHKSSSELDFEYSPAGTQGAAVTSQSTKLAVTSTGVTVNGNVSINGDLVLAGSPSHFTNNGIPYELSPAQIANGICYSTDGYYPSPVILPGSGAGGQVAGQIVTIVCSSTTPLVVDFPKVLGGYGSITIPINSSAQFMWTSGYASGWTPLGNYSVSGVSEPGLIPALTADNSSGYLITASSEYSSSYLAYMCMASSPSDWADYQSSTGWIEVAFPTAQIVTSVAMEGRSSNEYPTTFTIQQYVGSTWVTLATETNPSPSLAYANGIQTYSFTNTTASAYYRINFTASSGTNIGLHYLQMYGF